MSHAAWCWVEHFLPYFAQHRVTRPFLAGNGLAPCSNPIINKSHEFLTRRAIAMTLLTKAAV
jgi:hypothetical protein